MCIRDRHSTLVLQLLTIGILINALARVPFTLIQGVGRPDITAKLHLIELPVYLVSIWFLLRGYALEGAAIAWVLRASLDAIVLFVVAHKFLPIRKDRSVLLALVILLSLVALATICFFNSLMDRAGIACITLVLFLLVSWFFVLEKADKNFAMGYFRHSNQPAAKKI